MIDERKAAAYTKIQEAVDELTACLDQSGDGETYMPVAHVLLIGGKRYDDEGRSEGCVYVCPAHGKQANWETEGLLSSALASVQGSK